ncbi:MAG: lytic murein transglycosylase, partial [Pseudomonadota bacterium]
ISSSYRAYAVDFDKDGQRDLWQSIPDVTGSVANYFRRHGWQTGKPIAERIEPRDSNLDGLVAKKLKPNLTTTQLSDAGIALKGIAEGKKSLHRLLGDSGDEYWVAHKNFYVITRYNHSKLYAMAVFQLSELIESAFQSAQ